LSIFQQPKEKAVKIDRQMARSSLSKAEWSGTREEWYKKECEKILFDRKLQLHKEDDRVYLDAATSKTLLTTILKPKTEWYETWLKLKDL
jgi:hypothetical protein